MIPVPTFTTKRLTLRQRSLADTEACLAMDRTPGVTRFIRGPWSDPMRHRAFVEARTTASYPPGQGYWTIEHREDGRFIGWVLLIPADSVGPEIEIGWRIVPEAWNNGYASEAASPLVRHAFATLGLPEVIADIDRDNRASRRVAEKIGLRSASPDGGGEGVRYALTHDGYRALSPACLP